VKSKLVQTPCLYVSMADQLKYVAEFRWIGFFLCTVGASHVDFAVADGGKRTHYSHTHLWVGSSIGTAHLCHHIAGYALPVY
jgi:hypothetical protein